jgi:hypothetical protein
MISYLHELVRAFTMYGMPDLHGNLFMGTLWSEYHKEISYMGGGGLAEDSDYPGVSGMQRT